MKNNKGFTLVELVITIAVIVILSVISVPIYQDYTTKAKLAEGYNLLATIRDAQLNYYNMYGNFLRNAHGSAQDNYGLTCNEEVLGVNARTNKYFTAFSIGANTDPKNSFKPYIYIPYYVIGNKEVMYLIMYYNLTSGVTYSYTSDRDIR